MQPTYITFPLILYLCLQLGVAKMGSEAPGSWSPESAEGFIFATGKAALSWLSFNFCAQALPSDQEGAAVGILGGSCSSTSEWPNEGEGVGSLPPPNFEVTQHWLSRQDLCPGPQNSCTTLEPFCSEPGDKSRMLRGAAMEAEKHLFCVHWSLHRGYPGSQVWPPFFMWCKEQHPDRHSEATVVLLECLQASVQDEFRGGITATDHEQFQQSLSQKTLLAAFFFLVFFFFLRWIEWFLFFK